MKITSPLVDWRPENAEILAMYSLFDTACDRKRIVAYVEYSKALLGPHVPGGQKILRSY